MIQDMKLSGLDFQPMQHDPIEDDTGPISNSSSFNSLLSQNEDLAARLRVTLKRLALQENEYKKLLETDENLRSSTAGFQDQLLIWKEKEKLWKDREQQLEKTFKDQNRELSIETDLMRQKIQRLDQLEETLERYKKYHEKIKTSVKPYIQKLKGYTESLFQETRSLNNAVLQKESEISLLQKKYEETKGENSKLNENSEIQKNRLISIFEDERHQLYKEMALLRDQNETLIEKNRMLDRSLERQDELENLIVALRRSKDDFTQSYQQEITKLKTNLQIESQDLKTAQLKVEDLDSRLTYVQKQLAQTEKENKELTEQLTSVRYMWTQKSQENENLKMSTLSLEKINLELSQKLSETRLS